MPQRRAAALYHLLAYVDCWRGKGSWEWGPIAHRKAEKTVAATTNPRTAPSPT